MMAFSEFGTGELVARYRAAAVKHGEASSVGDYKGANKAAKEIADAYRQLRARGAEAQGALLPLLDDDDVSVRVWAGAHALEFSPNQGERVLTVVESMGGPAAMDARMTLRAWREGTLHFP